MTEQVVQATARRNGVKMTIKTSKDEKSSNAKAKATGANLAGTRRSTSSGVGSSGRKAGTNKLGNSGVNSGANVTDVEPKVKNPAKAARAAIKLAEFNAKQKAETERLRQAAQQAVREKAKTLLLEASKATKEQTPEEKAQQKRKMIFELICTALENGDSLRNACRVIPDAPSAAAVLHWCSQNPEFKARYEAAQQIGYALLAEDLVTISDETHATITVQDQDEHGNLIFNADGSPALKQVHASLSSDVISRNKLRIDTRKWVLSKMLPKVYGDKVTQEISGPDGGALQLTSTNLRGLDDAELAQMEALLTKTQGAGAAGA